MSEANARYEKFLRDVERDINSTVAHNLQLLKDIKPSATSKDYNVDWVAPSLEMGSRIVDLAGDLMAHWRNYAVNAKGSN